MSLILFIWFIPIFPCIELSAVNERIYFIFGKHYGTLSSTKLFWSWCVKKKLRKLGWYQFKKWSLTRKRTKIFLPLRIINLSSWILCICKEKLWWMRVDFDFLKNKFLDAWKCKLSCFFLLPYYGTIEDNHTAELIGWLVFYLS